MKYRIIVAVLFIISLSYASLIDLDNIKKIIDNSNSKLKGEIRAVQVAPYNNDIISFEVKTKKSIDLFLYNMSNKRLFQIKSFDILSEIRKTKKVKKPKDTGIVWHPTENYFVFTGNAYKGRSQLFVCEILNDEFINKFAVKGYIVRLREKKGTKYYCKFPSFDKNGKNLYFSRKKRGKGEKYSICVIKDFLDKKSKKFRKIEYDILIKGGYDQLSPVCSSQDDNIFAYISFQNEEIRGDKNYYTKYDLSIYDIKEEKSYLVDNLDGYKTYPFMWSKDGKFLLYFKAVELFNTPQELIDYRQNQIDLHIAGVEKDGNSYLVELQSNGKTKVVVDNARAKYGSVAFVDDHNFILGRYNSENYIDLVNINYTVWKKGGKDYLTQFDLDGEFDYPVVFDDQILFLKYVESKAVSTAIMRSKLNLASFSREKKELANEEMVIVEDVEIESGDEGDIFADEEESEVNEREEISKEEQIRDKQIVALNNQLAALKDQLKQISSDIDLNKKKLKIHRVNLDNFGSNIEAKESESSKLSRKIASLKSGKLKSRKINERLAGYNSELIILKRDLNNIIQKLKSKNGELEIWNSSVESASAELQSKQTEKVALVTGLKKLEEERDAHFADVKENRLEELEETISNLKSDLFEVENDIADMQDNLSQDRQNLIDFNDELTENINNKSAIKNLLNKLKRQQQVALQSTDYDDEDDEYYFDDDSEFEEIDDEYEYEEDDNDEDDEDLFDEDDDEEDEYEEDDNSGIIKKKRRH